MKQICWPPVSYCERVWFRVASRTVHLASVSALQTPSGLQIVKRDQFLREPHKFQSAATARAKHKWPNRISCCPTVWLDIAVTKWKRGALAQSSKANASLFVSFIVVFFFYIECENRLHPVHSRNALGSIWKLHLAGSLGIRGHCLAPKLMRNSWSVCAVRASCGRVFGKWFGSLLIRTAGVQVPAVGSLVHLLRLLLRRFMAPVQTRKRSLHVHQKKTVSYMILQ